MTSSVADALVGRIVDGRYRILSHLADGGMASVYVAMDARLDREVALKIMRPGLAADDVFVERFRSEARSAARLSHPNVVAVYDQGEDGGDVFLAMELVHGKTLREVIHEEAPLTAREALAILEAVLSALRAAHNAGIIHRDVKPENVIVRRDGEVKVADFGLARAITNQTATSQTGVLLGTVSYLSPEQVEKGVADPRSDVYAAGLLLFEMLTGRKAVTGDTPIQIAYKHVHGGVPAPSSLVRSVPAALDALVADATAVSPEDRFASAGDFLAALRSTRKTLTDGELDEPASGVVAVRQHTAPLELVPDPRGTARPGSAAPVERTAALPLPAAPRGTPRRRRRRWPWLLAVLLLVSGGAGGWWFTAGPGGTTRVPATVSHSLADATSAIHQASLRLESSEAFSEGVPKGQVISMRPEAGTEVAKQSLVSLVVSKGPERYVVPTLVGTKAADIAGVLGPLTLKSQAKEAWSETVPKGVVVSQQPEQGTQVKRGALVEIVVSKGRQPITVPTVTGLSFEQASKKISDAGLKVARGEDVNHDTVPAGEVVSQRPAKGTLFRGETVTIVVSKGPVMVEVPNVQSKPIKEAEATLKALGFQVEVRRPLGTFFELVRDQSTPGGEKAPKGSTITLTVV